MKRILKATFLVAVSLLALSSCQKEIGIGEDDFYGPVTDTTSSGGSGNQFVDEWTDSDVTCSVSNDYIKTSKSVNSTTNQWIGTYSDNTSGTVDKNQFYRVKATHQTKETYYYVNIPKQDANFTGKKKFTITSRYNQPATGEAHFYMEYNLNGTQWRYYDCTAGTLYVDYGSSTITVKACNLLLKGVNGTTYTNIYNDVNLSFLKTQVQ